MDERRIGRQLAGLGVYAHETYTTGSGSRITKYLYLPRVHSPKPKLRQIGANHGWSTPVWMCHSRTHAAVEPTAYAAYKRWEGML